MSKPEAQQYDSALKSLLGDEVAEILPNLLPGSVYLGESNIEIDRSTLKPDLVYNILYMGIPHVADLELQTDADSTIEIRLAKYHIGLYDKHKKPVLSVIIYPFKTTIPKPPFIEKSGDRTLMMMDYTVLPLWKMDAEPFIRNHTIVMYTFLPAMRGVTVQTLTQAIEEMKRYYSPKALGDHLSRFQKILWRTTMLNEKEKQMVDDILNSYDSLMDDSPAVVRNLLKSKRESVVTVVETRFPTMRDLTQQQVASIKNLQTLDHLLRQVVMVPDEGTLRWLLSTYNDAAPTELDE